MSFQGDDYHDRPVRPYVVTGGRVHLVDGFHDAGSVTRGSRWTVGDLVAEQDKLLARSKPGIPQFGIGF